MEFPVSAQNRALKDLWSSAPTFRTDGFIDLQPYRDVSDSVFSCQRDF
jgi:hypothetical protein